MNPYKPFLLLLLSAILHSCNNQPQNESKNPVIIDSTTSQAVDDTILEDSLPVKEEINTAELNEKTSITATKQIATNNKRLSDLYKELDKTPQLLFLTTSKDTTFVCAEGTTIKIKAGSFVSEKTGKEISGNVQITVKEYYKLSEILFAKLSTSTDGNLLESGGMIHIAASSANENCILKPGGKIEIGFPTNNAKDDMQLFTGVWKNDDQINWELIDGGSIGLPVSSIVDQMPRFPGGERKLLEYIRKSVKYPASAIKKGIQGTAYIQFTVGKDSTVYNANVMRGFDPACDNEALRAARELPKFIPGSMNGVNVNSNFVLPIRFSVRDGINPSTSTDIGWNTERFEKTLTDTTIKNVRANSISNYIFSTSQLGWINCDRFYKDNTAPQINYSVQINTREDYNSSIVFHKFKAILRGETSGTFVRFDKIPSGEPITLIVVKFVNKEPYLAVKETETSSKPEMDLAFQHVTMELLKSEMKKLDRFNQQ